MGQLSGKLLIVGMLALAVLAATFAWRFQQSRGDRLLAVLGSPTAVLIRLAPEIELWQLEPATSSVDKADLISLDGVDYAVVKRRDLSQGSGIVHARQAIIEDRSYIWDNLEPSTPDWTHALRFGQNGDETLLWFDLPQGHVRCDRGTDPLQLNPAVAAGFQAYFAEQLEVPAQPVPPARSRPEA